MAKPKSGYFVYNGNVYERNYRPLDDAWTIYDENGTGVDYTTNKAVHDAAAATADDAIYEDLATAKLNISSAPTNTVRTPGLVVIPHIEPIAALDPSTPEGAALQAKIQALPSEKKYQGLFEGNMQSYQARKNWVAEHQDYLKAKNANIDWANYRGEVELNLALKSLLGGYDAWNASRQPAEPVVNMSPSEKFIRDGYATGGWQDAELQNMEGSAALYLNKDDYNRWQGLQFGLRQARPYVAPAEPAKPVLNPNAPRKDIYNPSTAVAPRAQANPIAANPDYGTDIANAPTSPRADFIQNAYTRMSSAGTQAGQSGTQARPKTVEEARLQKAQSLTQSSSPIDNALGRMYLARNKAKHKIGGKVNYQKIFK